MAKGLTNAPLRIVVDPQFYRHPAVLELMRQGHDVHVLNVGDVDLILHPAAHAWTDDFWDYLPAAITAARRRRRETK